MKNSIFFALLATGLISQAQTRQEGIPVQVNPLGPVEMINVVVPGQTSRTTDRYFVINVRNTCFGTNLRGVQNPLGPDSQIRFAFELRHSAGTTRGTVVYDGKTAIKSGSTIGIAARELSSRTPNTLRAAAYGNVVRIEIPVTASASVNSDGEVIESAIPVLSNYGFHQIVSPTARLGRYMARTGALSATTHILQPNGSYSAEIQAAFPGQEGYCGGYHSPLMVFFDEARPQFTGSTDISFGARKSNWPEKGAPGYFIAFDEDKNKKIDSGKELFGASEGFKNGFEKLKKYDSNKDGVLDAKDKDFKKLVLFRDWDGKPEIIELYKKIDSIDLKYQLNEVQAYGTRAEAREKSSFKFKEAGKEKQGSVIDIWFSAIEN